ncbi:MAG: TOBE domain-containing protein, partial [Ilumatobacteraceae bacterium]
VEAMTMGSRVAVLNAGRLEQVGTPQDVYDHPASTFVAQFIGTPPMNLLQPGQLGSSDVRVGVRPEHLLIAAAGELEGTVRQVEHLGHEVLLLTESPAGRLTARVAPHADLPIVGETVRFDVAPHHLHRFDAVTGVRVP